MMLDKNPKAMFRSPEDRTYSFGIVTKILQASTFWQFLFLSQ